MASSEMSIGGASVGPGGPQSDGPSVVPGAGTNKETGDGPGVVGHGGDTMNAAEINEWDQMHSRLKWSVSYYSSEYPSVHFVYSFVLGGQVWRQAKEEAS